MQLFDSTYNLKSLLLFYFYKKIAVMTSYFKSLVLLCLLFCVFSCTSQIIISDVQEKNAPIINDTTFVNLKEYSQDIQKKMWKIVSNPQYVANPAKGSIHNRGGAVDITLVDSKEKELPMGTDFDFFGIEASHNYPNVSAAVKQNRLLLKSIMTSSGFNSFDSEWWHYNLKSGLNDKVSDVKWDCK